MQRASFAFAALVLSIALGACAQRTNVNKPPASCPCASPGGPRR